MAGQIFGEIANPSIRLGTQKWYAVPVSILAHIVGIAAIVIVPLLVTGNLPEVPLMMAFVAASPPPPALPPPPPPAAAVPQVAEVPVVDINPNAAPIEAPAEIVPETAREAFDISDIRGVEGGIVGGVIGGVIGGVLTPPPPPPPPAEPIRVGGNISQPQKTKNVEPQYPEVARVARVSGIVILEAVISPDGRVTEVTVLRSVKLLDGAAVAAVRQWEYTPTLLYGVPVPVIMTVTVNFQLR